MPRVSQVEAPHRSWIKEWELMEFGWELHKISWVRVHFYGDGKLIFGGLAVNMIAKLQKTTDKPSSRKFPHLLANLFIRDIIQILGRTPLPSEKPQFFVTGIIQGVWNISLRFWLTLSWLHHIIAPDLVAAHSHNKSSIRSHPKATLLNSVLVIEEATQVHWTHCHVHGPIWDDLCVVSWYIMMLEVIINHTKSKSYYKMGILWP